MSQSIAFIPVVDSTVNISVTSASQRVEVKNYAGSTQIRVCNAGTATVWISFGGSGVTASMTADIPVPAGAIEVYSAGAAADSSVWVAAIAAGSTGSVYFTPGNGI